MTEATNTLVSNQITQSSPSFTLEMIENLFTRIESINAISPTHRRKRVIVKDWIGNSYPLREVKLDSEGNLYLGGVSLPLTNIAGLLVGSV